jgi:hypothetical protein
MIKACCPGKRNLWKIKVTSLPIKKTLAVSWAGYGLRQAIIAIEIFGGYYDELLD